MLARADAWHGMVSLDRAQAAGEVRLGLPPALADLIFGTVVQRVSAKHPDVHLICREGAAGLVEEVENGSLDLAVVSVTSTRSSYRPDTAREGTGLPGIAQGRRSGWI